MPPRPSRQLPRWKRARGRFSAGRLQTVRCDPGPCHSPKSPVFLCARGLHVVFPWSLQLRVLILSKLFPLAPVGWCRVVLETEKEGRVSPSITRGHWILSRGAGDHNFSGDLSRLDHHSRVIIEPSSPVLRSLSPPGPRLGSMLLDCHWSSLITWPQYWAPIGSEKEKARSRTRGVFRNHNCTLHYHSFSEYPLRRVLSI